MRASITQVLCALVLPSLLLGSGLLVGCGDDGSAVDMAGLNTDMPAGGDMTAAACVNVATWPSDQLFGAGTPDPLDGYDFLTTAYGDRNGAGGLVDTLRVEIYHKTGSTPAIPRTVMLPATGTYGDCDDCVLIDFGQDFDNGDFGTLYFARGGSLTVTKADRNPLMGGITVSGSNVRFVEWNFDGNNDKPVANGKCIEVGSFSFNTTYDNNEADGGTD